MALGESLLFYAVIGVAVAAAVAIAEGRRPDESAARQGVVGRAFAVLSAVFFWPLFLSVLLAKRSTDASSESNASSDAACEPLDALACSIAQVEAELVAALASLDGWAEAAIARERVRINELRAAWRAQAQRIRDMDRVLATADFKADEEPRSGAAFAAEAASRAVQSTRARRENFARLRRVRDQADRDLGTTLASVRELVSMIHLAKFTGEPASRADELVTQIAAAVEGLSEVAGWNEMPAA